MPFVIVESVDHMEKSCFTHLKQFTIAPLAQFAEKNHDSTHQGILNIKDVGVQKK